MAVIDALEVCRIPYMLVGGIRSVITGSADRLKDADFVVELVEHAIASLTRLLGPRFGLTRRCLSKQ